MDHIRVPLSRLPTPVLSALSIFPEAASNRLHVRRPYRVPGGYPTAVCLSILCMAFILQAVVFFIFKPGAVDVTYVASVLGGVIITIIVG